MLEYINHKHLEPQNTSDDNSKLFGHGWKMCNM